MQTKHHDRQANNKKGNNFKPNLCEQGKHQKQQQQCSRGLYHP
jgi:hypothetical protein